MFNEFMEMCAAKAETDGQYAIAYAILLNGNIGYVPADDTNAKALEWDMRRAVDEWLAKGTMRDFSRIDVWTKALGETVESYDLVVARVLTKCLDGNPALQNIGSRKTAHGSQRMYRIKEEFFRKPQSGTDDLGI